MTRKQISRFIYLAIMVLIILVAYYWGIKGIKQYPIIRDELTTLGHIGAISGDTYTIPEAVDSLVTYSLNHPPFYYVVMNIWGTQISFNHTILFMVSVFFGSLALATTYRLATDMSNSLVAILATMLMASSIMFVHYSHELREYSTLTFLTAFIWFLYNRAIQRKSAIGWKLLAALFVTTALYIYTHYAAIFFLIAIGVYHLFFVAKSGNWWRISITITLAGLTFVPWLPHVADGLARVAEVAEEGTPDLLYNQDLLTVVPQFWGNGSIVLFIALLALGFFAVTQRIKGSRKALIFLLLVTIAVLAINHQIEFVKRLRYLVFSLVPFYILGAMGLSVFLSRRWGSLIIGLFFGIWIVVGTGFQTSESFFFRTALDSNREYLEYQLFEDAFNDILDPDDLLVTVVRDFKSIKQSKQKLESPEDYYFNHIDVSRLRIHSSPEAGSFRLPWAVDKLDDRPDFWITYRYDVTEDHQTFLDATEGNYRLCNQISYGDRSYLDHYVRNDQFDSLCSS